MKTLENINLARLTNLEFGQQVKTTLTNIGQLGGGALITDAPLQAYLSSLTSNSNEYDRALVQITKSDETAKIVAADKVRDAGITAAQRYLSVFELSTVEAEKLAFDSLDTLFVAYKGIQNWNFEEETNGIDNLVADLTGPKYAAHVATLAMGAFVARIAQGNADFKAVFYKRTLEVSTKEAFDIKALRAAIKVTYTDMAEYVLSMAKAINTDEFNQTLGVINAVRKYYSDLLAKRKTASTDEPPTPTPAPGK